MYHLPEFQGGQRPSGLKEVFNHAHSSLRNVIERSFGGAENEMASSITYAKFPG